MNILFLVRLFYPHQGGVEKHVLNLSLELINLGNQITIITEQYNLKLPIIEEYKNIKILRIPNYAINSKINTWRYIWKQYGLIQKADILHIHDVGWWYFPFIFLPNSKPYYITFHGYEGSEQPKFQAIIQRKIIEIISRGSICIGSFMKKWYYANPKIISYGASTNFDNVIACNNKHIIFFGRNHKDTGINIYYNAIKQTNIYSLYIYTDKLTSLKNIKNNIHLSVWNKNIIKKLQKYRYIFVSRYLSILESMQAKRLVFAVYDNRIKKDYLMCHPMKNNMMIAGSVPKLINQLKYIEANPKIERQMINSAYQWAKLQTWEKLTRQYLQLWQNH